MIVVVVVVANSVQNDIMPVPADTTATHYLLLQ